MCLYLYIQNNYSYTHTHIMKTVLDAINRCPALIILYYITWLYANNFTDKKTLLNFPIR